MRILARAKQLDGRKINTTLIATLGASSSSKQIIAQLIENGMSVARFNLQHGTRELHETAFRNLQEVLQETGGICATMVTLRGLTMRTGKTENVGEYVSITERQVSQWRCAALLRVTRFVCRQLFTWRCSRSDSELKTTVRSGYIDCDQLPAAVKPGMVLRIDDLLPFEIYDVVGSTLVCVALANGMLASNQRVQCATVVFPEEFLSSLEARDEDDLAWAQKLGFDFIVPTHGGLESGKVLSRAGLHVVKRIDDGATLAATLSAQIGGSGDSTRTVSERSQVCVALRCAFGSQEDFVFRLRRWPRRSCSLCMAAHSTRTRVVLAAKAVRTR
jgi:hypothetical protein